MSSDAAFTAHVHLSQAALSVLFRCHELTADDEALLLSSNSRQQDADIWKLKLEPQTDDIAIEEATLTTAAKAIALNNSKKTNAAKKSLYGGGESGAGLSTRDSGVLGTGLDEFGITAEMLEVNPMEDQSWNDLSLDKLMA